MKLFFSFVVVALALSNSLHAATAGLGPDSLALVPPLFAQASLSSAATEFISAVLAPVLLLIGIVVIAYGGFLINQGRTQEGLMAIIGGFIIAVAVPVMKALMAAAGITF